MSFTFLLFLLFMLNVRLNISIIFQVSVKFFLDAKLTLSNGRHFEESYPEKVLNRETKSFSEVEIAVQQFTLSYATFKDHWLDGCGRPY